LLPLLDSAAWGGRTTRSPPPPQPLQPLFRRNKCTHALKSIHSLPADRYMFSKGMRLLQSCLTTKHDNAASPNDSRYMPHVTAHSLHSRTACTGRRCLLSANVEFAPTSSGTLVTLSYSLTRSMYIVCVPPCAQQTNNLTSAHKVSQIDVKNT